MFSDLWWDDFLQVTARVSYCSLHHLGLEPYSQVIFKWGLKVRNAEVDGEESTTMDRAMEYAGVVGVELADMLASINLKVEVLVPRVPAQHTFGRDRLQNFICDHQDCLEHLEGSFQDLMTMVDHAVRRLLLANESYCWDLCRVERLNSELLVWVMALEVTRDHPIIIPDSPLPIPIPAPGGNLLVEIVDRTNDAVAQMIAEDQAEGVVRRRVTIEEGGVFGVAGEFYEEGEDVMDVLCQVEAWDAEILRYWLAPYDNLNYIPDI